MSIAALLDAYAARESQICLCLESECNCEKSILWSMPDDVIAGRLVMLHGPRLALELLEPIANRARGSFVHLTPELAQRLVRLISEASGIEVVR